MVWVVLFVIFLVIIGQEGGYTYNFMGGFGPKGIHAAGGGGIHVLVQPYLVKVENLPLKSACRQVV